MLQQEFSRYPVIVTGSQVTGSAPESAQRWVLAPAQLVLDRIRAIRSAQGLTIPDLAQRLAELGYPITENRLWNLESGRTKLHVDTLFAIAAALGVSPLALQTAPDDEHTEIEPAPGVKTSVDRFNAWMTGTSPLPGSNERPYVEHHPYGAAISRFRGDLEQRTRALAIRIAAHAEDAASTAAAYREEAHAFAAALLEQEPSEDMIRTAEALSKRLGLDLSAISSDEPADSDAGS